MDETPDDTLFGAPSRRAGCGAAPRTTACGRLAAPRAVAALPQGLGRRERGRPRSRPRRRGRPGPRASSTSRADGRRMAFESMRAGRADPRRRRARGRALPRQRGGRDRTFALAWLPRDALFDLMAEEPAVARDIVTDLARPGRRGSPARCRRCRSTCRPASPAGCSSARCPRRHAHAPKVSRSASACRRPSSRRRWAPCPRRCRAPWRVSRDEGLIETRGAHVLVRDVGGLARRGAGYSEG